MISDEQLGDLVWRGLLNGKTPPIGTETFDQVSASARVACITAGRSVRDALLRSMIERAKAEGVVYAWSGYADSPEEREDIDEWIQRESEGPS